MRATVVVPAYNEQECLETLLREIRDAIQLQPVCEVIVVDDGSSDATLEIARSESEEFNELRIIRHLQRYGQSQAVATGIRAATGDHIILIDADGQNDPSDIRHIIKKFREEEVQTSGKIMIAGQRRIRRDNTVRRLSSRIANYVRSQILRDGVRDTGCSLKLFRREDFLNLPYFNHIHRFIPAMMKASGVTVVLVDVGHRPRLAGVSKYGVWDRLWIGICDLIGVAWLMRRLPHRVETEFVR